jgi:aspartokinase/homoserine dehydrogenase 1
MKEINLPNSIFVDCTADDGLVRKYKEILESNISIVTPNKKANTGSYKYYLQLKESALKHNVKFLYETNVGAGLPIIGTLKDMVSSGDKVIRIEGVLSGTLSYIFNSFQNGKSFSRIVNEAREKGYTEPDPREDLNGMDVARKLLILAREIGQPLELKQIKVENLVPPTLRKKMSIDEFLNRLKEFDRHFEKKKKSAQKNEKVLRYIASLENGRAQISLQEIAANHPFYLLTGSDNILAITSRNYKDRPMVIKGPGAGADVTAAGVFADIIRISNYLS